MPENTIDFLLGAGPLFRISIAGMYFCMLLSLEIRGIVFNSLFISVMVAMAGVLAIMEILDYVSRPDAGGGEVSV